MTVTSDQHAGNEGEAPVEQFSLNYSKIEITYTPQAPTGAAGTPITGRFRREDEQEVLSPHLASVERRQEEPAGDEPMQHRERGAGEI